MRTGKEAGARKGWTGAGFGATGSKTTKVQRAERAGKVKSVHSDASEPRVAIWPGARQARGGSWRRQMSPGVWQGAFTKLAARSPDGRTGAELGRRRARRLAPGGRANREAAG